MIKELTCRYGHICTSRCQNDIDCPCLNDHCCEMSQDCEGQCDDCLNPLSMSIGYDDSLLDNITIEK